MGAHVFGRLFPSSDPLPVGARTPSRCGYPRFARQDASFKISSRWPETTQTCVVIGVTGSP